MAGARSTVKLLPNSEVLLPEVAVDVMREPALSPAGAGVTKRNLFVVSVPTF